MSTSTTQSAQKIADDILVDLALQGGGAHGAFTWGVLDRLLEEKRLRIDGISGTSAGAMNAAVLADGYTDGGPDGARKALEVLLERRLAIGALQSVPARPARRPAGPLVARPLPDVRRHGHDVEAVLALRSQPASGPIRFTRSWPRPSISSGCREARSSCSSPRPTSTPAEDGCSATANSRPTCCSPRPACPLSSRRSRSTASTTGTAAMPETPRSRRWCANANRGIPSWCRSIRSSGRAIRARRATSSTA